MLRLLEQSNGSLAGSMSPGGPLLQEEELERLQAQLSAAQQAAQASNGREAEARAQAREYGERARKAEALYEEAQTEIAHVRWAVNGSYEREVPGETGHAWLGRCTRRPRLRLCMLSKVKLYVKG